MWNINTIQRGRRITAVFSIIIIAFFCAVAHAAEVLTWQDCVARVAKNNPDILAAREALASSENLAKSAYSGFMPQITASGNATRGNSYSFSQLGGVPLSTPSGDSTTTSASIQLTQNIFNGFMDQSLVTQTAAKREAQRAALYSSKVQASFNLRSAFAALLYAQKYFELTDQITKRREGNAELVTLHFESGMENKGSVLLSKAFVGQAKYDHMVARDSIDVSRQMLSRVMGLDDSSEFQIAGDMPLAEPGSEPDLKALAAATPQHLQSVAVEKSSEAGVPLARGNFFPNLSFTGTISAQGNDSFPNTSKRSLMFNLSLPVFSGGKHYHDLKSAAAQYAQATFQRQSVDQQLLPNLKQAFRAYEESIEKLKVDQTFVEAAEVRAEIARARYNNGLMSFEDWDIIENDLINKQKIYLQSERDRILAEASWELASGKGVIP